MPHVAPAELPSQREQIEGWISEAVDFTPAEKELARRVVAESPEGYAVCHGDFHPANILLTARGPILIDWPRAGSRWWTLHELQFCLRARACRQRRQSTFGH